MTCSTAGARRAAALLLVVGSAHSVEAQISRFPTGVNVNATNATSVVLTYGNLNGKIPVEAVWCGEIESAVPALGDRCVPSTLYGRLPVRYDQTRSTGPTVTPVVPPVVPPDPPPFDSLSLRAQPPALRMPALPRPAAIDPNRSGLVDVMTIPASVARRAYQAAARGEDSRFYYVRRFIDPAGGPDEYVVVTCRLTDGGARTPFSLADVRLGFSSGDPLHVARAGEIIPDISAELHYNGTGRLRGRWEVVRPGEALPTDADLVTEATLPLESRRSQRRYTELARFDVFLPPGGPFALRGPDAALFPTDAPGTYLILLRIEASDDKEGDVDLASTGLGLGVVANGGVAGFSLPPLRYFVGGAEAVGTVSERFRLESPAANARLDGRSTAFRWTAHPFAAFTRIELTTQDDVVLLEAILPRGVDVYFAPTALLETEGPLRWRAVALSEGGRTIQTTPWRALHPRNTPTP
ncbi:MAG: hypothetical protein IT357_02660 [Gemmatimonadaceae bacterium]|nr:hypothetical protein [Gemmatimonadaceae bacterium]